MGCGASADISSGGDGAAYRCLHTDPALRSASAKAAADAPKMALYEQLDRTLEDAMIESDGSEVDGGEPSSLSLSLTRSKIVIVARVQHGINGDVNQFVPEKVPLDLDALSRVYEWFAIAEPIHVTKALALEKATPSPRETLDDPSATSTLNETSSDGWHARNARAAESGTTVPGMNNDDDDRVMPPGPFSKLKVRHEDESNDDTNSNHSHGDDTSAYVPTPSGKSAKAAFAPVAVCVRGKRVVNVKLIERMASGLRFPLQECTLNAHDRLIERAMEAAETPRR